MWESSKSNAPKTPPRKSHDLSIPNDLMVCIPRWLVCSFLCENVSGPDIQTSWGIQLAANVVREVGVSLILSVECRASRYILATAIRLAMAPICGCVCNLVINAIVSSQLLISDRAVSDFTVHSIDPSLDSEPIYSVPGLYITTFKKFTICNQSSGLSV